jgi:hypothetical protein
MPQTLSSPHLFTNEALFASRPWTRSEVAKISNLWSAKIVLEVTRSSVRANIRGGDRRAQLCAGPPGHRVIDVVPHSRVVAVSMAPGCRDPGSCEPDSGYSA